jgi:hypothetical protein
MVSETATTEKPEYRKQKQDKGVYATKTFMIIVEEGWREWILCTDMYEWAADGLLNILRQSDARWPR